MPDKESSQEQLLEAFAWEWEKYHSLLQGKKLVSIYFGGGTPSLFGPDRIHRVLQSIYSSSLSISPEIEITLEANPERITLPLMKAYAAAGINRVSIGVQTLDPELLKILSRLHSAKMAIQAIQWVFEAGITNISIDLMYDLPKQTLKKWESTLDQASALPISHLSLYNLTIEPHTMFFRNQTKLKPLLPDEENSLAMYEMAIEKLEGAGLKIYEISAFAKPECYSKHNTGYWTGRPFIGLGPSAFSYWEGKRFRNIANLNRYYQALKTNASPIDFEEELEPYAHRRELLVIQLRLRSGINLTEFEKTNGPLDLETKNNVDRLISNQLLTLNNGKLSLTYRGMLCYDSIASELI